MELNLASFNCKVLRITATCEIEQSLLDRIKECSALPEKEITKDEGVLFGNIYLANNKKHAAIGSIERVGKKKEYFIRLHYYPVALIKKPNKFKPVSNLLNCLKEIRNKILFDCIARFEYASSKYNSVVPLPIKLRATLFDEIIGFRLVKHKNKELYYDIIIEKPIKGKINHSISFDCNEKFSNKLPKIIFDKINDISKSFIAKK